MNIILTASEVDYEEMYELIIPFAKKHLGSKINMFLPMGKKIIGVIPRSAMDKIITELISSREEIILSKINKYFSDNNIFMTVDSINGESSQGIIKITVNIQAVDYEGIAEYILPLAAEKAKAYSGDNIFVKAFGKMEYIPEGLGKTFLQALPRETKDELVIYLINNYQDDIIHIINKYLHKNNIKIKIKSLCVAS